MKMKYLMLGTACLALCASTAWAATTAPAGAVVGWWKFDDPNSPGLDSSEYGNHLTALKNASCVAKDAKYTSRGYYNDSGCLEITSAGGTYSGAAKFIWDKSKGYTYLMRVRTGVSVELNLFEQMLADEQMENLVAMLNDNGGWHVLSYRYDPAKATGTGTYYYGLFGDDPNAAKNVKSSVESDDVSTFLIASDIKIGGSVTAKSKTVSYKGYIDDAVVVARTMSKSEIQTFMKTGEFNPFLRSDNDVSFNAADGWSCNDTEHAALGYGPHNLPGADFQVYGGQTIKATSAHAGKTFGGHSLSIGRSAPLVDLSTGAQVSSAIGNFVQQASVTIPDLRLNDGKLTGSAGTTLTATKLTVNATAESPFEVNVDSGDYAISGAAAGTGSLLKTGAGTLDLRGLTGAAKVVVSGGKVLAGPNVTVVYAEDEGAVPVLMVE